MPQVLHPNARVDKLKEAGRTVISHILYDDAAEANLTGSDPLKTDISDGFYRIVQHRDDGTVADASLNLPSDVAVDTALPVQMEVDPGLHTRTWRLTRQYGIEDSFTIVPYKTPIEAVNKKRELGTTTFIKDDEIHVGRSKCYSVWTIECKSKTIYIDDDGTPKTIHHFRIGELGSDQCWRTDEDGKVVLEQARGGRPLPIQLYELVETAGEEFVAFSASLKEFSVTASNAALVKKFYFGTSKIGSRELSRYLSIQLETDARDQGWATEPHRGLWSWFELAIFKKMPEEGQTVTPDMIKAGPKGEPLTWLSHTLPLNKNYAVQKGPLFGKDHEIWGFIEQDDHIGVLACAQYARWKAESRSGKLMVRELIAGDPK